MIVECATCHARYNLTSHEHGQEVHCRCGATIVVPEYPETAKSLNCPQCGASCSPNDIKCAFCGAYLAVVPCPRCFDLLFVGTRHCPRCGAEVSAPAYTARDAAASEFLCPRCGAEKKTVKLTARIAGETLLDQCAECGGVWMDMQTFERVLQDTGRHMALRGLGLEKLEDTRSGVDLELDYKNIAYLKCPQCGTIMHRKNFGKRSGVIIDTCKDHGVWLDRGELARVLDFVTSGGLELSQKKDLEALKQEIALQRASLTPPTWQQPPPDNPHYAMSVGTFDVFAWLIGLLRRLFQRFRSWTSAR